MAYEERYLTSDRKQNLTLENREKLTVTGVMGVESFDDAIVIMETFGGALIVRGSDLKIGELSLDAGTISVTGRIAALEYEEEPEEGRGFFSRLFR